MPPKFKIVTREDLYTEVWTESVTTVAARYGMSDVALAKRCRTHGIPIPGRGYWRLIETGKRVDRPPLPPLAKGASDKIVFKGDPKPQAALVQVPAEQATESRVVVLEAFDPATAHGLARSTWRKLSKAKPNAEGYLVGGAGMLALKVTPATFERTLRIFDALLKAFEKRGHRIADADEKATGLAVVIGEERLAFAIEEKTKSVPYVPTAKELAEQRRNPWINIPTSMSVPGGQLALLLDSWQSPRRTWADGRIQRVETCLNDFIATILITAEKLKAQRLEETRRQEILRIRAERRRKREEFVAGEVLRIGQLEAALEALEKARRIRELIEVAEQRISAGASIPGLPGAGDPTWLSWAREYADRIDPLSAAQPPMPVKGLVDFEEWYAVVEATVGKIESYQRYRYEAAYNEMKTPEEAAAES